MLSLSFQRAENIFPVFLSLTRNINIDLILKRHMNSILFPLLLINSMLGTVWPRLDLKLKAKFLWKLQFYVSVDSNALTKWRVAFPDCVHVI